MKKLILCLLALITMSLADAQTGPGSSNLAGLAVTNSNGIATNDFSKALINLQNDIQQLLPMLAGLNSSTFLSNSNLWAVLNGGPQGSLANAYASGQQSAGYGSPAAGDSSAPTNMIVSTLPGGSTVTTLAETPVTPSSINGTNTATLMAIAHYRLFGGLATNGMVLNATEQETLRSLIILQSDLERTLTLVKSLNNRYESPQK